MKRVISIKRNRRGLSRIAYLAAAVIVIALLAFVFFGNGKEACGNGICRPEKGETCASCPKDCGPCHAAVSTTTTLASPTTSASTTTTSREEPKDVCGDGICSQAENCWDCPQDCKCAEGAYCSHEEMKCVLPVCGNGKCEIYENSANCCIDCPCELADTTCNNATKMCETPPFGLGDDAVRQAVLDYYAQKSMTVENITLQEVRVWVKTGRVVQVKLQGQSDLKFLLVTETKEVIELPFL
jgi:hypothetical protein